MNLREGKASECDPGKIAAMGVLRLCSGLARRGGGERKEQAPLVDERERGGGERSTEGRGFGRRALGQAGSVAGWAAASLAGPSAWPARGDFPFFLN